MTEYNEWQPIETPPKDGTYILVCCSGFRPAIAFFAHGLWCQDDTDPDGEGTFSWAHGEWPLSHWMPLPSPPDAEVSS